MSSLLTVLWRSIASKDGAAARSLAACSGDVVVNVPGSRGSIVSPRADLVYEMLRDLKVRGVPVDGIGMRMHLAAGTLPLPAMKQHFGRFPAPGP